MRNEDGRGAIAMSDHQNDVLREMGNIGSGHVLTVLSQMTKREFSISAPDAEFLDYEELPAKMGDAEDARAAVTVDLSGDIEGIFMFIADRSLADALLSSLGVGLAAPEFFYEMEPMQRSALLEVGNIVANSYVTAICGLTGLSVSSSVPAMSVDMLGALLNLPVLRYAVTESRMIYMRSAFCIDGEEFNGNVVLFPDHPSLERLMASVGPN